MKTKRGNELHTDLGIAANTQGRAFVPGQDRASVVDPSVEPSFERIAQRAYELYMQRGDGEGSAEDDWLRAKRELES